MPTPLFEFFEIIAEELSSEGSRVITRADLQVKDNESPLLDDLKREMKVASTEDAIQRAVERLSQHFEGKGAKLPFDYEAETGRFTAKDHDYLEFVKDMSSIRSINTKSRDFECRGATR